MAQKKEMDEVRERQRLLREERDVSHNGDYLYPSPLSNLHKHNYKIKPEMDGTAKLIIQS